MMMKSSSYWLLGTFSLLLGCQDGAGSAGKGRLRIMVSAEASITEGLALGADVENTRDYAVSFSKYLVTIGNVSLARSRGGLSAKLDQSFVVDMLQVGEDGVELGVLEELRAGEWDKFGFETPSASPSAQRYEGVSPADYDEMVAEGYTYWLEGRVERAAAQGGPVDFTIKAAVPTLFRDCEYDAEPGVSVVADGSATATLTLHGDHVFFNAFPTGAEATIERLSGYIVAADKDGDGEVGNAELAALDATEAFTRTRGYSLDGAPIPIDTALDFVRAQLATQGHYQGEGECIFMLREE